MSKFRLIIFDFDGTLADSAQGIVRAMNGTLESFALEKLPSAEIINAVGHGMPELINRLVKNNLSSAQILAFRQLFKENYLREQRHHTFLYPLVRETLSTIVQQLQLKIAIVSNKPSEVLQEIVAILQLDLFPWVKVAGADSFAQQKPDPLPIFEVMKMAQVKAHQTLMVGDGLPDLYAARNAQIDFLGVSFGLTELAKLQHHGAASYIDHFEQLLLKL